MNYDELDAFQTQAESLSVYPLEDGLIYVSLGLISEVGEVCDQIKKSIRNDGGRIDNRRSAIIDELGDVMWYTAVMLAEVGIPFSEIEPHMTETLEAHPANLTLIRRLADDGILLGDLANWMVTAAAVRAKWEWGETRSNAIYLYAGLITLLVESMAEDLGSSLEEVLDGNLSKLEDRRDDGQLKHE